MSGAQKMFLISDFVQKHFVSATNVFQFAQPKKHHGQQCVLVYQGFMRARKVLAKQQSEVLLYKASPRPISRISFVQSGVEEAWHFHFSNSFVWRFSFPLGILDDEEHKLYHLLPPRHTPKYNFRQSRVFDLSYKTNRTKNSFINFQCNLINNNKNVY